MAEAIRNYKRNIIITILITSMVAGSSGYFLTSFLSSRGDTSLEIVINQDFFVKIYDDEVLVNSDDSTIKLRVIELDSIDMSMITYDFLKVGEFSNQVELSTYFAEHSENNRIMKYNFNVLTIRDGYGWFAEIPKESDVTWLEGTKWHYYWSDDRCVLLKTIGITLYNCTNTQNIEYLSNIYYDLLSILDIVQTIQSIECDKYGFFPNKDNRITFQGCGFDIFLNQITTLYLNINGWNINLPI